MIDYNLYFNNVLRLSPMGVAFCVLGVDYDLIFQIFIFQWICTGWSRVSMCAKKQTVIHKFCQKIVCICGLLLKGRVHMADWSRVGSSLKPVRPQPLWL